MNPRVVSVVPLPDYCLELHFTNQEKRFFNVKPYLSFGIFSELKDGNLFNRVKSGNGGVWWPNDIDLGPNTLYLESVSDLVELNSRLG
ncbi:DUF2442 domain-containing protein [Larkinella soli]|uniref:DUF2442 domain-containing protein n=1 Tax=Larkinella soli TaxID=1770527 RepID=UPI000FFC5C17|nr:DUF2442 domain-containing protein [Larkinella soli]